MWWIRRGDRLKSEVASIEALQAGEPWLPIITKRLLPDLKFAIDFDIVVNGETLPFTLEYPAFFPETPPTVIPRDGRRHSGHQYGAGGEMCLEFRSDNWDPAVTGAMMIESVHRLLAGEQPDPDRRAVVPSAHQSSLGQQLRSVSCRFLLTRGFRDHVAGVPVGEHRACGVVETTGPRRTWTTYVNAVGPADAPTWRETTIPASADKGIPALLVRVASVAALAIADQASLDALVAEVAEPIAAVANADASPRFTILADASTAELFFSYISEGKWTFIKYRTIDLTDETGGRLPAAYASLAGKKVGLVGCGSLGSKIATSLGRSGVGTFVLVDDDILKPGNLVRNDLDVASLGAHKVEGLEARLLAVAPGVTVSRHRIVLGGQESSGTTSTVLDELAACDLLIDATADPQAFNFVASVARSANRPMIWAEVYAGGIGGFVARLRPGIEPPPHTARRQYLAACRRYGVPWNGRGREYDAERPEAPALVADDADVSVIAAHAARMATDSLIRAAESAFPHPAYFIGLSSEWIFEEPFDTRPLHFSPEGEWQQPVSVTQAEEAIEFIVSIAKQSQDADRNGK